MKVLITGGNGDIAKIIKKKLEDLDHIVFAPGRDQLDVTNLNQIESIIYNFCPDVLINNAGIVVPQSVKNADYALTIQHININLLGTFLCTQVALKMNPQLIVINIGSAASVTVHPTWSEYCASKAAVVMATKCWAEDGVYAICLSPGRTETKMRKSLFPDETNELLLSPSDFADVVVKAVNKEFINGSHIIVRKNNVQQILNNMF